MKTAICEEGGGGVSEVRRAGTAVKCHYALTQYATIKNDPHRISRNLIEKNVDTRLVSLKTDFFGKVWNF